MATTPPDSGLKHLSRLYGLAKIFSRNEPEARQLVEDSYRGVSDSGEEANLLHLLRGLVRGADRLASGEVANAPGVGPDVRNDAGAGVTSDETPESDRPIFRAEALATAQRALGPAFAALSAREQLAILLVEVQGLHAEQLAVVFECPPPEALAVHQRALSRLVALVMEQFNPVQLEFVLEHLPDSWIGQVVESMAWQQLPQAPEPLRSRIATRMGPRVRPAVPRTRARRASRESATMGRRLRNALLGITLVVLLGTLSYQIAGLAIRPPETNVIQLTAAASRSFTPSLMTNSRTEAASFFDAAGRGVEPPEVAGAELVGAGLAQLAPGIRVPALRYSDRVSGDPITIYGLTYRDLDRYAGALDLPGDVLRQIQNDLNFDLHPLEEGQVLVWRRGAWILLAVSAIEGAELRERIYAPED